VMFSGLVFYLIMYAAEKEEFNRLERSPGLFVGKVIPADFKTLRLNIGFRINKIKDYFVVDNVVNGIDYEEVAKFYPDKVEFKRMLFKQSIKMKDVDYLVLILSENTRPNNYEAEYVLKNAKNGKFLWFYTYKMKKESPDKRMARIFESENTELIEYIAGITGKNYKIKNYIK